jgi:hypothetical protein
MQLQYMLGRAQREPIGARRRVKEWSPEEDYVL